MFICTPKKRCDLILVLWRYFCATCSKTCSFKQIALCDLKRSNTSAIVILWDAKFQNNVTVTCIDQEPPKGVGKEGVGNSSTDLVSVQDWQPLLNPWLTLGKPDFVRSPGSWITVRKSPRKILHSELVNCWSTLSQCIANSRPHKKLREPSLRRTSVGTQIDRHRVENAAM